ncbi:hypothetical protein [Methanobrevibacter sp.]
MKFNKICFILSIAIIFMISMGVVSASESYDLTDSATSQSDSSDLNIKDVSDSDDQNFDDDSDYDSDDQNLDDDEDYDSDDEDLDDDSDYDEDYDSDDEDLDDDSDYDWDDDSDYDWDDDEDYGDDDSDNEYIHDIDYSYTTSVGIANRYGKFVSMDDKAPQDDMDSNANYPMLSCGGAYTSNDDSNKNYESGVLRANTPKAPGIAYKTADVYLSTEEFNDDNFGISNYVIVNDRNDILKMFKPSVLGYDSTNSAVLNNQFSTGFLTVIVSFILKLLMLI